MKQAAAAFAAGLLFAMGLGLSGMTLPSKVIGFLDVAGAWDPSLAFVMVGAIGVHLVLYRFIVRRPSPLLAASFALPKKRDLDAPLLVGAALFGVGWGLGGYCPGPGIASLLSGGTAAAVFVGSMVAGMVLFRGYSAARAARAAARAAPEAGDAPARAAVAPTPITDCITD